MQIGFTRNQGAGLQQDIHHRRIAFGPGIQQGPSAATGGEIRGVDVVLDRYGNACQRVLKRGARLIQRFALRDQSFRITADPGIQRVQSIGLR